MGLPETAAVPGTAAPVRGRPQRWPVRVKLPPDPLTGSQARSPAAWRSSPATFYLVLIGAVGVLAGLSLLFPSTPSYDPWAWLGWGREIVHLGLHTTGGPSWKPLPVLFTTLFAPFGAAQPGLWLLVARAGAMMAVAMVFRLAYRLTEGLVGSSGARGSWAARRAPAVLAGLIAAVGLLNSGGFIVQNALGYSEGLAVALMLVAVDRFLDGAPRQTLVVGFFAGLDRPEVWVAWVPFGLWLARRDPAARRLVLGLFVVTPVIWFLPELWGSGQLFRGVARAHHPRPGTAPFTRCPLCTVLRREAWPTLLGRVKFPAIVALMIAAGALWRTRSSWWAGRQVSPTVRACARLLVLGGAGFLWWLGIAAETQAGFAGDTRYLEPGTALVVIAGGVAWGWIALILARGADPAEPIARSLALPAGVLLALGVLVATPPWVGRDVIELSAVRRGLDYQAGLRSDLAAAIRRSGGARALLRCGSVMTEGYQVPMLAWMLGVPTARIQALRPTSPGHPGRR